MVECGGLENRFTGAPGDEGSNPSSSAILVEKAPKNGSFFCFESLTSKYGGGGGIRTRQGATRKENAPVARF